jgi:hypothetical protein
MGLFGDSEEDRMNNMGLLGLMAGGGILSANQPGVSMGQALGQGFAGAGTGLMQMQKMRQQAQQMKMMDDYRKAQIAQMQAKTAQQKEQHDAWKGILSPMGAAQPVADGQADGQPPMAAPPMGPSQTGQPMVPPSTDQTPSGQPQAGRSPMGSIPPDLMRVLSVMEPAEGAKALSALLAKQQETGQWERIDKDGKPSPSGAFLRDKFSQNIKPIDPTMAKVELNPSFNMPPIQTEEDKALGQHYVKEYGGIVDAANSAESARNQIRMARSFSDVGSDGKELPSVMQQKFGNAAVALGMNVESPGFKNLLGRVTDGQSFVGATQNLVLTKMQAQKGPQTENDAKRIEQTVASLGNTPEARDFLLRASDALAYEDILKRDHYETYRKENGTLGGAAGSWRSFRKEVPFMGVSPATGKPVFFSEFSEANSGRKQADIISAWKKQYGG